MIPYTPPVLAGALPVIDLSGSFARDIGKRRDVAWEMHKACRDTGFFYVANHRVPHAVLTRQLEWSRQFFALPLIAKLALKMTEANGYRGYEPMMMQTLDSGSPPDLKEGFQFNREDGPAAVASGRTGINQWPDGLSDFRAHMLDYQSHMILLGRHLMRVFALSLDLDEDYFADALEGLGCSVRLLHYPPQPGDAAANQLGAGAHTDWGALTMLLQDDVGGLEIRHASGTWIRATPIPGALVVNLGEMTRRWTNDLYRSTLHRVYNAQSGRDRYSVATFFNVNANARIECVPTCRPAVGEPLHPPCTAGEHSRQMFEQTYGRKLAS